MEKKMDIPSLSLPDLSPSLLENAANILLDCKKDPLPEKGFPYPYIAPGGGYGTMWWQLDFSIALTGMRFLDHSFCKHSLLNFITAQKENGRIPLWGNDRLPEYKGERMQREEVSSLPKLFDAAWKIAESTDDKEYLEKLLSVLVKYIAWFQKERFDSKTGLFSAVFEETFIPYYGFPGEYAPVDLNMELLHGFFCTAKIAKYCGKEDLANSLTLRGDSLQMAIRKNLWDEERKIFAARLLKKERFYSAKMASAFAALRYGSADGEQKKYLLEQLLDPARYNWGKNFLTSVDMTDERFFAAITTKTYFGNPCWSGNIWSLINENAIRGLMDSGEKSLAATLAVHTLELFQNAGFCEFINPLNKDACGVTSYAWTAGNCIDIIFSVLFGIRFNCWEKELLISPAFPEKWKGKSFSVKNLTLPDGSAVDMEIRCNNTAMIHAKITRKDGTIKIYQGENSLQIPLF